MNAEQRRHSSPLPNDERFEWLPFHCDTKIGCRCCWILLFLVEEKTSSSCHAVGASSASSRAVSVEVVGRLVVSPQTQRIESNRIEWAVDGVRGGVIKKKGEGGGRVRGRILGTVACPCYNPRAISTLSPNSLYDTWLALLSIIVNDSHSFSIRVTRASSLIANPEQ